MKKDRKKKTSINSAAALPLIVLHILIRTNGK